MNEETVQLAEIVSVKFKSRGKAYFFSPDGKEIESGSKVVVDTSRGLELADCVRGNHFVREDRIVQPLRPVVRIATGDDLRVAELCAAREQEAFKICEEKIIEHKLDMKLVDVECNFEGNKILFFFTSDGRVDFRELVRDLASVFRTRIELRQIGVRDEAKILGGIGICGRQFCCSGFLDEFHPVSTKMAKTQSISLNPAKISGSCGRLMCCLRYEQEAYEELVKTVPKNGAFVETPEGYGNVTQVNLLRQKVKVKLDGEGAQETRLFDADEVAAIPGGRPKPGEELPHILVIKEKPKEEEENDALSWTIPEMIFSDTHMREPEPVKNPSNPRSKKRKSQPEAQKPAQNAQESEKKPAQNRNRRRSNKQSTDSAKPQNSKPQTTKPENKVASRPSHNGEIKTTASVPQAKKDSSQRKPYKGNKNKSKSQNAKKDGTNNETGK